MSVNYTEYIQRIRRYKRDTVITAATNACWTAWEQSETGIDVNAQHGRDLFCARAYGPRIAVLSANGNNSRESIATTSEAIKLAHLYLRIREPIQDRQWFKENEFEPLLKVIGEHPTFRNTNDLESIVWKIAANLFPIRAVSAQWAHVGYDLDAIYRYWRILEILNEMSSGYAFSRITHYLNMDPIQFIGSAFGLFVWAAYPRNPQAVGRIGISGSTIDADVQKKLSINKDIMRLAAVRLSRTHDEFRQWHNDEVVILDEYHRKYAPNPLVVTPLIQFDTSSDGVEENRNNFVMPSPWHYIWSVSHYIISRIGDCFGERADEVNSMLGNAVNEYVYNALNNLVDVEVHKYDDDATITQHPDFLIPAGNDSAFLVEVKNSIGHKSYRAIPQHENIIDVWSRLYGALMQCVAASSAEELAKISQKYSSITKIIAIICINDHITTEGISFLQYIKHTNTLQGYGILGLEILSIDELEALVSQFSPADLFDIIQKKWADGKGDHFLSMYISTAHHAAPSRPRKRNPDLIDTEQRIFKDITPDRN